MFIILFACRLLPSSLVCMVQQFDHTHISDGHTHNVMPRLMMATPTVYSSAPTVVWSLCPQAFAEILASSREAKIDDKLSNNDTRYLLFQHEKMVVKPRNSVMKTCIMCMTSMTSVKKEEVVERTSSS